MKTETAEEFSERHWNACLEPASDNRPHVAMVEERDAAMKLEGKRELLREIRDRIERDAAELPSADNRPYHYMKAFMIAETKYATRKARF